MDEVVRLLYIAYLGKEMGTRIGAISKLVKHHDGRKFFEQYSTSKDSILDFLKRCDAKGAKLW